MVDTSISLSKPIWGRFLLYCGPERPSLPGARSIRVRLLAFQQSPRDMRLHLPLASKPLKRKPLVMGKRAPRTLSIADGFCRLPSPEYAGGLVAPDVCPLALAAARAPRAAKHGDATSVIVSAPPLEIGQQVWSLLGRGPGSTSQGGYSMADRQIDSLNKRCVQSSRKTHPL
jgi:hypothetical protein